MVMTRERSPLRASQNGIVNAISEALVLGLAFPVQTAVAVEVEQLVISSIDLRRTPSYKLDIKHRESNASVRILPKRKLGNMSAKPLKVRGRYPSNGAIVFQNEDPPNEPREAMSLFHENVLYFLGV
jgi:hypothetical protein